MSALFQPLCQVRLTNVAVVRLRSHGYRFEVACYKNKVLNWRSGIESNIDEVLQTPTVFHNVSKGEFARKEALLKAFGTEDESVICQRILSKGEIQVAEKERKATLDAQFKDVVTVVTELGVNPSTGLPLTRGMVEGALKDIGFSVKQSEPAKKQALKAMEQLQKKMPEQIARAQMRLKIDAIKDQQQAILKFLVQPCDATIESQPLCSANSSFEQGSHSAAAAAAESSNIIDSEGASDHTGLRRNGGICKAGGAATYSVVFLCDPCHYRELDQFTLESLVPPATLQLLSSNVKTIRKTVRPIPENTSPNDLRHNENNLIEKAEQDRVASVAGHSTSPEKPLEQSELSWEEVPPLKGDFPVGPAKKEKVYRCSSCLTELSTATLHRQHCQSGWHLFNLKRKVKQLPPITEQEFDDVSLDRKLGFLSVDS
eukprot:GHVS01089609.1.p1 GENE.GHVS01089609.1~~GHVS01089609.1.p1  ORF type:complete len:429 (+),score=53.95 GHVS01089609.1:82-1368(+)